MEGSNRHHLEKRGGFQLRALNRRRVEGVECFQADISDLEAIKPAFDGVDVVVHLAAQVNDEPFGSLVAADLVGAYNVYEAARTTGVKRVVFASSGEAATGWEVVAPYDAIVAGRYDEAPERWPLITHEMVRPGRTYGAAKVWGEALGRYFSDAYGISVVCVRIGRVRPEDRPLGARDFSVYLSHRDVVDFLHRCIEAPDDLRYDIFFATSNNKWGYRDLEHPRRVLGFEPQDSAEVFR